MPSSPPRLRRGALAAAVLLAAACDSPSAGGVECPEHSTGCARVEGRVLDGSADPIGNATVSFRPSGLGVLYQFAVTITGPNGRYALDVWRMSAAPADTVTVWVRAAFPFQVGGAPADSVQVHLHLAPPGAEPATVRQDVVIASP